MLRLEDSFQSRLERLAQSDSLNILLPAGIGDCLWALTKLGPLAEQRDVMFWLPEGEQKRAGDYLRMCGVQHRYFKDLRTRWVWDRDNAPPIPERGWISCHANLTLENGCRIETWYPELPAVWPGAQTPAADDARRSFVLLFPGSRNYMRGNLEVPYWVDIAKGLQKSLAPVRLIGAGHDVEFVKEIASHIGGSDHLYDRSFDAVLAAVISPMCRAFMGVASGPLIAATVAGAPTMLAYPRHLTKMPGTWEQPGAVTTHCFVDELPRRWNEIEGIAR